MAVSPVPLLLLLLTTLLACFSLSSAAVWQEEVKIVPGHDNQCWVAKQKTFYDAGSTWSEPNCVRGSCSSKGTRIERHSCGTISCGPGLKVLEADENAAYPDCCPQACIPDSG